MYDFNNMTSQALKLTILTNLSVAKQLLFKNCVIAIINWPWKDFYGIHHMCILYREFS
jgi:hypothetical protein